MLWRWNLPGLCIFMRPFIWHNIWALPLGRKRAWSKNLWKKAKKSVFAPNFDHFFKIQQKLSNIWCVTLHWISGKTFKQIWPNFMGLYPRNQKTDLQSHFCYHYLNSIEKKIFFLKLHLFNKRSTISSTTDGQILFQNIFYSLLIFPTSGLSFVTLQHVTS